MEGRFCIFIYGLSGSGKTTLASALAQALRERTGVNPVWLDGAELRSLVWSDVDFSRRGRLEHARRVAGLAQVLQKQGYPVIVCLVAPFEEMRQFFRTLLKDLVEVWLDCPLHVCRLRDPTGIYKLAEMGEVVFLPGQDVDFETPSRYHIRLRTDVVSVQQEVEEVLSHLESANLIP